LPATATDPPPQWRALERQSGAIRAGEPIKIPIVGAASGTQTLDIAARLANVDDWLKSQLLIFLP
jgi:hypothetical protein